MLGPEKFVAFLQEHLYHPRSSSHGNEICRLVVDDLINHCPSIATRASSGEIVARLNLKQRVGHTSWKIDLALGRPAGSPTPPPEGQLIRYEKPAIIQVALETKAVMTEHRKARLNRLRDFEAFHEHAHRYNKNVVAVALVVVNASEAYWSPMRAANDITIHRNISVLAQETVDIYRGIPLRNKPTDGPGLEAFCAVVVRHDNLRKNPNLPVSHRAGKSKLVTGPPAPEVGDPFHYASMIHRICDCYLDRFA